MPNNIVTMEDITKFMIKQIAEMKKDGLSDKQIREVVGAVFAPLSYGKM